MIKFNKIMFVIFIAVTALACDNDNEKDRTAAEESLSILKSKSWNVAAVTVDGIDQTQFFSGLTISFTDHAIRSSNGRSIWREEDTWQFTSNEADAFQRGDGIEVRILKLSRSMLEVQLTWTEKLFGPGRAAALNGEYVFRFE